MAAAATTASGRGSGGNLVATAAAVVVMAAVTTARQQPQSGEEDGFTVFSRSRIHTAAPLPTPTSPPPLSAPSPGHGNLYICTTRIRGPTRRCAASRTAMQTALHAARLLRMHGILEGCRMQAAGGNGHKGSRSG